jgi:hypothetical protein
MTNDPPTFLARSHIGARNGAARGAQPRVDSARRAPRRQPILKTPTERPRRMTAQRATAQNPPTGPPPGPLDPPPPGPRDPALRPPPGKPCLGLAPAPAKYRRSASPWPSRLSRPELPMFRATTGRSRRPAWRWSARLSRRLRSWPRSAYRSAREPCVAPSRDCRGRRRIRPRSFPCTGFCVARKLAIQFRILPRLPAERPSVRGRSAGEPLAVRKGRRGESARFLGRSAHKARARQLTP